MKNLSLFALALLMLFSIACETKTEEPKKEPENLEAPKAEEPEAQEGPYYGEEFEVAEVTAVTALPNVMKEKGGFEGQVQGTVKDNCTKAGCWMQLNTGEGDMRVTFKDYGFFIPKDSKGKDVVIQGKVYYDTTSVEHLRHYAEDAGASEEEIAAITEPKLELRMEATGVYFE